MYQKVEPWFDIVALEHQIQSFWTETKAFETLRRLRRDGPRWSFLDGPITANNPMGVHHAWGRTLKDVYQRYFAMTGHQLRYQNGFDCQGLWVEVEVEKELGFKSKRDIENYGMARFVEQCKQRVQRFSKVQTDQSIRLGYWMDWDHSYFTMSDDNNYTIWSFLKKCHERNLIYRGTDVMPWCPRCGVGLSQMEMHEGYKLTAHRAVFLRFPLRGRPGENLLVWTTTPWTLTSNVAAAVHPDLPYVKVRAGGQIYYLAEGTLNLKRKQDDFREGVAGGRWVEGLPALQSPAEFLAALGGFEVLDKLRGAQLVGWTYDGPFDDLPAQHMAGGLPADRKAAERCGATCHRVVPWALVSDSEGTGIVHIAPGCGKEDYELGQEQALVAIAPLDENGVYVDGFGWLTGLGAPAHETTDRILADLQNKGVLVHVERYPHTYPHCWRCSSELLFRLVDEWFIAMAPWKQEIMKVVEDIRWLPAFGKELEIDWLRNMRDWMISKKRYWGLALPIWVCQDPACHAFEVIGGRAELQQRAIAGLAEFEGHSPHRPWIDAVQLRCPQCNGTMARIEDVGNPWLDAGIVPYSTMGYNEDRAAWQQWFPADLVLECFPGQFRNWFYAMLAMSTMMEGRAPFKTLVGHALVRDEQGREMHKSLGNAIWFDDAVEQMGADVMRWIYGLQDPTVHLNFGHGVAREVRGRFINTLWNTYAFFVNYARLDQFVPAAVRTPAAQRCDLDRWALSNLQRLIGLARHSFENFDCRAVCRAAEQFVEDLSNWYVRRSRRRFWRGMQSSDSVQAYETLYECLEGLLRVLAPMLPHLTEAMYQNLVRSHDPQAPASIHHVAFPEIDPAAVDEELSQDMEQVIAVCSAGLSARNQVGLRVRQPLSELIVQPRDETQRRAAQRFAALIQDELNVKQVTVLAPGESLPVTWTVKPDFKQLGPRFGRSVQQVAAALKACDPAWLRQRLAADGMASLTVDGTPVDVTAADVAVTCTAAADLSLVEEGGARVAVRTTLTPALEREGLVRDLVRRIQMLRKESGLNIEDRIRLRYWTDSTVLQEALQAHSDYLCSELLCVDWAQAEPQAGWLALAIRGANVQVAIEKAADGTENR